MVKRDKISGPDEATVDQLKENLLAKTAEVEALKDKIEELQREKDSLRLQVVEEQEKQGEKA